MLVVYAQLFLEGPSSFYVSQLYKKVEREIRVEKGRERATSASLSVRVLNKWKLRNEKKA